MELLCIALLFSCKLGWLEFRSSLLGIQFTLLFFLSITSGFSILITLVLLVLCSIDLFISTCSSSSSSFISLLLVSLLLLSYVESLLLLFVLLEVVSILMLLLTVDMSLVGQLGLFYTNFIVSFIFIVVLIINDFNIESSGLLLVVLYFKLYIFPFGLWMILFYYSLRVEILLILSVWVLALFWLFALEIVLEMNMSFIIYGVVLVLTGIIACGMVDIVLLLVVSSVVYQSLLLLFIECFGSVWMMWSWFFCLYAVVMVILLLGLLLFNDTERIVTSLIACCWMWNPILIWTWVGMIFGLLGLSFSLFIVFKVLILQILRLGVGIVFILISSVFIMSLLYYFSIISIALYVSGQNEWLLMTTVEGWMSWLVLLSCIFI